MARRRRRTRQPFDGGKRRHLLWGQDFFSVSADPDAGGYGPEYRYRIHPDMEADWEAHGEAITADWITRLPGSRPWAWWGFSSGQWFPESYTVEDIPRILGSAQSEWLAAHGCMLPEEAARAPSNHNSDTPAMPAG